VTLGLSVVAFPLAEKFERGEVGEGLMRPDLVVGIFPAAQLLVESIHVEGTCLDGFGGSPVCSLG
jgi:hypothetical protein